ncbi:hypothetical protein WJX81_007883 [Elliptochloris bilobata]|uniref:DEAD-box ATP-dependent RNA helicase 22 n=1 Tax=Elliptochloris bilobata TaxID=381761 RepID=A0AAW1SK12_9CHLO
MAFGVAAAAAAEGAAWSCGVRGQPVEETYAREEFLAEESVSFEGLGLRPEVVAALSAAGFPRPASTQAAAAGPLLAGHNLVLAAETGSGKTLAYLAPLLSRLLQRRADAVAAAEAGDDEDRQALDAILVLCPNAALCQQVVAFSDALRGPDGAPLVRAAHVATTSPPPREVPDLVAATPAGLITATQNYGPFFGWEWTRAGVMARMRAVVIDEADQLLTGGYERDCRRVLDALREGDRARKAGAVCAELRISPDAFQDLPRHLRRAAYEGGAQALKEAGFVPPGEFLWDADPAAAAPAAPVWGAGLGSEGDDPERGRSRSAYDRTWRRQYVYVAATLPAEGGRSVANDLKKLQPDAVWVSAPRLHAALRNVRHAWRPVDEGSWRSTLQEVVGRDAEVARGRGRTLVFAASVAAADAAAAALADAGLEPLLYHRGVHADQRAAALDAMRSGEGVVLVATDAAARGIDIPAVTHVVQADFAASAIDFLHRVGRTGRAGAAGRVTSLYGPLQAVLAQALRAAVEAGEPVEGAFSRKRSFAKKLKRYGRYVPRGRTAEQG